MKYLIAAMIVTALALAPPAPAAEDASAKDREALKKELDDARKDLAEAARRVAELGRELGAEAGERFAFHLVAPDMPQRPMLGIAIGERGGDGERQGVEVLSVTPGGPADKAGIRAGDVITRVGKTNLAAADEPSRALIEVLDKLEAGSKVNVVYRRGDDERKADVTLEAFQPRVRAFAFPRMHRDMLGDLPDLPRAPMFLELMHGWGDIELAPVSKELGEYFGTDRGLLVVRAPDDGDFRLKDGDVILAIDGREPEDAAHAMRILRSYRGGEKLEIDIMRKRKKMSLDITVPERRASEHLPFRVEREAVVAAPAVQ